MIRRIFDPARYWDIQIVKWRDDDKCKIEQVGLDKGLKGRDGQNRLRCERSLKATVISVVESSFSASIIQASEFDRCGLRCNQQSLP